MCVSIYMCVSVCICIHIDTHIYGCVYIFFTVSGGDFGGNRPIFILLCLTRISFHSFNYCFPSFHLFYSSQKRMILRPGVSASRLLLVSLFI